MWIPGTSFTDFGVDKNARISRLKVLVNPREDGTDIFGVLNPLPP